VDKITMRKQHYSMFLSETDMDTQPIRDSALTQESRLSLVHYFDQDFPRSGAGKAEQFSGQQ